jgi:DNA-binding transcriptional MerR regulator/quercetin dioxygenase-like cupin family protein
MSRKRKQSAKETKGRLQFVISDVSNLLNVSASTVRMWENLGLILPGRTTGGRRVYSPEHVERLKYIQTLREDKKLNIEAIRQLLGTTERLGRPKANAHATGGVSIARHLRRLRRQHDMTLSAAAAGTDLSVSFLSSLERGQVNASIATLQKLAVFYKTNVQSFFGNFKKPLKHVKPAIRRQLSNEPGINIELLAFGNNVMEPHLYSVAPGATSGGAYHHEGEEFVYVLSGCCEFWLDELEHYLLQRGDSLYFSSTQTHRWSNSGREEAVLLWINTPPTF